MGERDLRLGFIEKSKKKGGKHYIQKHQAFAGSDFLQQCISFESVIEQKL